ncbi:ATP-binding cassette domain-containing protein [Haliea sp. E1-2-M8]|uniref:ABC transporter ATP-binding protein n=1 Tax=Haliea sp. E1-2-M8 TaxID=3064706 RepID=UPI002728044D|nr:ATP-binding cassette domain-containing protein [Haliea sp. E1-2-M8]MDO8861311.1 ATP-binding cassette domain-containing protein [Haliea sp. E1-2-M8]
MPVEARNLSYAYDEAGRSHTVLHDVSLSIGAGERVALLGRSGSGKSTLLNHLGGIDDLGSGSVYINGESLVDLVEPARTRFRRRYIGYVYQRFNLIPTLTAAENILLPLDLAGASRTVQRRELASWLDAVGLTGRDSRKSGSKHGCLLRIQGRCARSYPQRRSRLWCAGRAYQCGLSGCR